MIHSAESRIRFNSSILIPTRFYKSESTMKLPCLSGGPGLIYGRLRNDRNLAVRVTNAERNVYGHATCEIAALTFLIMLEMNIWKWDIDVCCYCCRKARCKFYWMICMLDGIIGFHSWIIRDQNKNLFPNTNHQWRRWVKRLSLWRWPTDGLAADHMIFLY